MPLILEQSVFAAKQETTAGTAESLTASEGVYNAFNVAITDNTEVNERNGQSSLDPISAVAGKRPGSAAFETELVGNGATGLPAWATVLLPCCGFVATSSTYAPTTPDTNHKTATIGKFEDGRLRKIAGAMGRFSIRCTVGMPAMISWSFDGRYEVDTDSALIAPTYPTTLPPVFQSATFTIGGTTRIINEMTINVENEVYVRPDPTATGGLRSAVITNRRISIEVDPEAALVATKDWQADQLANTLAAINCVIGSSTNNTITLSVPKAQVISRTVPDRNGVLVDRLTMLAVRSASAGDDAFTIAFS